MRSFLTVHLRVRVRTDDFLAGCVRALRDVLDVARPPDIAIRSVEHGRYEAAPERFRDHQVLLLRVVGAEDAACWISVFEGVDCVPGELLARIEAAGPEDGPAPALAAAAALSLARLTGNEVVDPEQSWIGTAEPTSPGRFLEAVRTRWPGTALAERLDMASSGLNGRAPEQGEP